MIFDYGGFPPESYQYKYAASGDGALAKRAASLLQTAGIAARLDESRGWDHGVFVPMMLMFPKADIPIVCLSLLNDPDPAKHFDLGRALRPLRDEGVLILGSGSSYLIWAGLRRVANAAIPGALRHQPHARAGGRQDRQRLGRAPFTAGAARAAARRPAPPTLAARPARRPS